jgi:riboflavin kinase/FMN adenylyltransferase
VKQKKYIFGIGGFDGVHLGHRELLSLVVLRAHALCATPAVITFEPLPAQFKRTIATPFRLTTKQERAQIIGSLGIKEIITMKFDRTLMQLTPQQFITSLVKKFPVAEIAVGSNFRFGREKQGTPHDIAGIGNAAGFSTILVPVRKYRGDPISSTRIRSQISAGRIKYASHLIGRNYSILGDVEKGRGFGQKLGFPTINLRTPREKLLPSGVFAGYAGLNNKMYNAVIYIGRRPSFERGGKIKIEAHVISQNASFKVVRAGRSATVYLVQKLRGDRSFASASMLKHQINKDISRARHILVLHTASPSF